MPVVDGSVGLTGYLSAACEAKKVKVEVVFIILCVIDKAYSITFLC